MDHPGIKELADFPIRQAHHVAQHFLGMLAEQGGGFGFAKREKHHVVIQELIWFTIQGLPLGFGFGCTTGICAWIASTRPPFLNGRTTPSPERVPSGNSSTDLCAARARRASERMFGS